MYHHGRYRRVNFGRRKDSHIIIVKNRGLRSKVFCPFPTFWEETSTFIPAPPSSSKFFKPSKRINMWSFWNSSRPASDKFQYERKRFYDLVCLSTWLNLSGYLFILFLYRLSQVLLTTPMWLRQRLTRLSGQLGTDNIHKLSKVVVFILVVLHTVFTQISTALK